jgi:hypothetical protein
VAAQRRHAARGGEEPCRARRAAPGAQRVGGHRPPALRSGPAQGGSAAFAFPVVHRCCAARLHSRARRITAKNGGFQLGQPLVCQ